MQQFTHIDDSIMINGCTITAMIEPDFDHDEPWHDCGHGPVSDWTTRDKQPGELILCRDGRAKRFYDFAAACRIARNDSWGVRPYSVTSEQGANGLIRLTGHWFDANRNLYDHRTDWHDCQNAARAQLYAMHRATMTARQYAASAAMQDYERLRAFCRDEWGYVGVVLTATNQDGCEIARASLWGIESDDSDYLLQVANELIAELSPSLPNHRVMIAADIGV